jgi:hypothetical protein
VNDQEGDDGNEKEGDELLKDASAYERKHEIALNA